MRHLPSRNNLWLSLLITVFSITSTYGQYDVVVAKDGSGNFTTVQAAIDAAPTGRTTAYKIFIKNGKYKEVVTLPSNKPFLELIGESAARTIITYDNYSGKPIPGGGGAGYGTNNCATVFVNGSDCALFNLSIENSTGYVGDGPQAVAVYVTGDRVAFKNCRLNSGQDTLWHNGSGRQYFKNCYIDGNTDFIFGSSIAVFDSCVIYGRDRVDGGGGGYLTAANTTIGQPYGEVFRDCQIPKNRGITSYSMGRPWQNQPKTVYLNTRMSSSIQPTGWSTWNVSTSEITYAEYKNKYYNGTPVDVSQRLSWSKQLSDAEAAAYYNNSNLFGAWDPCAIWTGLCTYTSPEVAISNFRAQRGGSNSIISWNISWPISGVTYDLYRSTDSTNYTRINSMVSGTDTAIAFSITDGLPAVGTKCFYYLQASKAGMASNTSDVAVVNVAIPLNGEYRSVYSGPWANSVQGTTTITSGTVTAVNITASPIGFTSAPTVTFTAAPSGGTTAAGTAIVTNGVVTGVNITNPGSGYTTAPSLTWNYTGAGGTSIWETYSSSTATWSPVALGSGPSNVNVTIRSGHTITMTALVGIAGLIIEQGAVLQSNASGNNLRVKGDVNNSGVFGGTTTAVNRITLEIDGTNGVYKITGGGLYNFSGIRFLTAVSNISLNINSNLVLSAGLQAWYGSNSSTFDYGTNDVTINVNPGVTVQAGFLHTSSSSDFVVKTVGKYTYNIAGTLDMSNSTTLSALIPHKTIAQPITLTVTGALKLGDQFSTNQTPTAGTLFLNIAEGGLVDAVKTASFNLGFNYFVTSGTGSLKRTVSSTAVTFPLAANASSYNSITLTNSGTSDNYLINVKPTFDDAVPDANKVVNRQWTISEDVAGGSNATLSLTWLATEQAAGFDPSQPVSIIRYNGSTWEQIPATISGSGTDASPYAATASGITNFSPFSVQNTQAVLPLSILSFTGTVNGAQNRVDLKWTTTNELNTKEFIIERKVGSNGYQAIGKVVSNNRVITNTYSFTDVLPARGVNYYRLRQVDTDNSANYSAVVKAELKELMSLGIFPNPTSDKLIITTPSDDAAEVRVSRLDGTTVYKIYIKAGDRIAEISVKGLPAGGYILSYENSKKKEALKKEEDLSRC